MYFFVLLLLTLKSITCAKILAIMPTPFYSHQIVFQPVWRELSLRGHQVTVITTNPMKNSTLTNLREIDISFTNKIVYEDFQFQNRINTERYLLLYMLPTFLVQNHMVREQLKHPQVDALLRSNEHFDIMIAEAHLPAWFGLSKKFNCPIVIISSSPATNFFKSVIGNMNDLVYNHNVNLPFGNDLNFLQRFICVVFEILDRLHKYFLIHFQESIIQKALRDPEINLWNILNNVSLLITNKIPVFSVATDVPSMVHTNGLQINAPQDLPKELKFFLDKAAHGAIYVSLGSSLKSCLLSEERKSIFSDVFAELPYNIVWKFEEDVINLPKNVKIVSWAPQQDILRHENIKLFITQGGLQSIDEAIIFKVPILGIPFFGDQFYNVLRVKELKLGSWLDLRTLTREEFKKKILETVHNATYLKNLKEMSLSVEHPLESLDKVVWWVEYVIRHQGAHHLRSPLADMFSYQYYFLDVGTVLFLLFALVILSSYILIKILWKVSKMKIK